MRGSLHLSAFVCTYFTHSEERARENVFLWGDNLKDNWWALCKDLQCWRKKTKNKILRYTNWQSERWPVADDPSAKILYAQKENSYHLKPNPGHLINHIYVQYIFPGSFTCWWFHLKRSRELKEDFRKFTFKTEIWSRLTEASDLFFNSSDWKELLHSSNEDVTCVTVT